MKISRIFLIIPFAIVISSGAKAQIKTKLESGSLSINDGGVGRPDVRKYNLLMESLDHTLKVHPDDTTALYEQALLIEQSNNIFVKSTPDSKDPIAHLTVAANLVQHAVELGMQDFRLKVLRAQIYKDLAYRFRGDEAWKFTSEQLKERKINYENSKRLANKYYNELALIDKKNAYDYQRLEVK